MPPVPESVSVWTKFKAPSAAEVQRTVIVPLFVMPLLTDTPAPAGTVAVLAAESVTPLTVLSLSHWSAEDPLAVSVPPVSTQKPVSCTVPPEAKIVPELLMGALNCMVPLLLASRRQRSPCSNSG